MSAPDVLSVLRKAGRSVPNEDYVEFDAAIDAVAKLAKCCDVTTKAFEALGRTNSIVAQMEAHRECERALIEQKSALANLGGNALDGES